MEIFLVHSIGTALLLALGYYWGRCDGKLQGLNEGHDAGFKLAYRLASDKGAKELERLKWNVANAVNLAVMDGFENKPK